MKSNDIVLFASRKWNFCILEPRDRGFIESFAIEELKKYLSLIAGCEIQVTGESVGSAIGVGREFARAEDRLESLGENGFVIQSRGKDIVITSSGGKGILNGVYEFLETLGCRWYLPGPEGEFVPKSETISVNELNIRKKPSFPIITFFQDSGTLRDYSDEGVKAVQEQNDRDLIDWAGKNKMNTIKSTVMDDSQEVQREWRKRGLSKEFGGHVIPRLLPEDLFEEHPEYFPVGRDNRRNRGGNVCCSNPAALQIIRENALKMMEESEGEVFHVWGEDVTEGGWCSCENCTRITVQDQYMTVVNAVAEAVEEVRPDLRVA